MTYFLDTSILIDLLRQKSEAWDFLHKIEEEIITTSSVCEAEIYEGVYRERPENIQSKREIFLNLLKKLTEITIFDSEQAETAGKIRAELAKKGSLIGDLDVLIAAAAMAKNAVLVTKNPKHFQKIPGLQVESF